MTGFPLTQQRRLLDLQALDSQLDVLDQRWRGHPAVQELIDITTRAGELEEQIEPAEQAADKARDDVRQAEREAEQIRSRQDKDRARLDAGAVSSPRELAGLQHEIETLQRKLDDVETRELEAMEELDEAQAHLDRLRATLADVTSGRERTERELADARAAIDAEREVLAAQRAEMIAELPDDLVARYERSRSQHGGVGVGALRNGRCEGCRLSLTAADLAKAATAPDDALLRCEECGRLLVRVAE